ncbi:MAG: extracellular solute-binding protein, partial [Myxococcales bacterium]
MHVRLAALSLSTALVLSACGDADTDQTEQQSKTVTVITHDSFALDPKLEKKFETDNNVDLKIIKQGDVGTLVNKLVLTKDSPLADAVYGIDNTFASRAVDEGVLADGATSKAPEEFNVEGTDQLTPVDYSDVCVNIDDTWFAKEKIAPPKTFDDLAKPAYKGLFALPGAT